MRDSETEVKAVLEPHHQDFRRIIHGAWGRWNALPDEELAAFSRHKRTRANGIWSLLVDEASRVFGESREVVESDEEDQQRLQTVTYSRNGAATVKHEDPNDPWLYEIPLSADETVLRLDVAETPTPSAPAARVRARQAPAEDKEVDVGND